MTREWKIIKYQEEDNENLDKFIIKNYSKTFNRKARQYDLQHKKTFYIFVLIAKTKGKIIGSLALKRIDKNNVDIKRIFIDRKFPFLRRQNIF